MESWDKVRLFYTGDEFFQSLIADIRNATRSVTIECYIFSYDPLTAEILKELKLARERGCTIKIVVDGFGSYYSIPQLDQVCEEYGIELRVFHPFPYPLQIARNLFKKKATNRPFFMKRMNRRNHRKIAIIDEKRAYLGSFNFAQEHCAKYVGSQAWRDTGVYVEGSPVRWMVLSFQLTYLRTFMKGLLNWVDRWKMRTDLAHGPLRLNTTQKMRRELYQDLLRRISRSQSRIYVTTAYFLPKRSLLRALLKAARRGVDVQILTPGKSDVPAVKWAAFYIVRFLLRKRVQILEYQKSILHAKTMIIDNDTLVGSFNLNHRSILHDLEVEVVLNDPASLASMLKQWHTDLHHSRPISEKDLSAPSWIARIVYSIAFRLRYML